MKQDLTIRRQKEERGLCPALPPRPPAAAPTAAVRPEAGCRCPFAVGAGQPQPRRSLYPCLSDLTQCLKHIVQSKRARAGQLLEEYPGGEEARGPLAGEWAAWKEVPFFVIVPTPPRGLGG